MKNCTMTRRALALGLTAWLAAPAAEAQVEQAWVAKYDGVPSLGLSPTDYVTDLVVRDGHVYLTGYESPFAANANFATVKYDDSGQELWVRRHTTGQSQIAEALAVDAAGNVYVTGWQKVFSAGIDVLTLKYSPTGALLWEQRYPSPGGNNQPNDIALDASGNIYVAGASWVTAQQDFDMLLLKYDTNGNLLWDRTLDNGDGQLDTAYEMAIDPAGNAILAGYTEPNAYLAKYSPTGDLLWDREHIGFSTNDEWRRIETDATGNIYVLGEISPPGQPNHLWTTKYDPSGNILWERTYTGTASQSCYAGGLAIMPDGGVAISGQSWDLPSHISIVTIRYAPDGTELWQRLEKAGYAHASGDDVVVDAEGRVYVTGYGYNISYREDIITLGYTPDGDRLWTQIYANPEPKGSDYPQAMAVDGAGNVFVAAHSWEFATSNDFTTIRYRQDLSAETVRLGNPANPNAFLPGVTSPPVIGATWDPIIDHTSFTSNATQDFAILGVAAANQPLGQLGTLLCDLNVAAVLQANPGQPFALPIPNDPIFFGVQLCVQGASVSPTTGLRLANALDITLGLP